MKFNGGFSTARLERGGRVRLEIKFQRTGKQIGCLCFEMATSNFKRYDETEPSSRPLFSFSSEQECRVVQKPRWMQSRRRGFNDISSSPGGRVSPRFMPANWKNTLQTRYKKENPTRYDFRAELTIFLFFSHPRAPVGSKWWEREPFAFHKAHRLRQTEIIFPDAFVHWKLQP